MSLVNYTQEHNGVKYKVTDLIEASKHLEPFKLKVEDVFINYQAPNEDTLSSFIGHCKRVEEADLTYPIILSPCNFILDGKHRLAKAILTNKKNILAVRLEEMPNCEESVE